MTKIRFILLALALALATGPVAEAKQFLRKLASEEGLDLSRNSPESQQLINNRALEFYEQLKTLKDLDPSDVRNLEEFSLHSESLKKRGYDPLEKDLVGKVFSAARWLTIEKKYSDKVEAGNGRPAYTSLIFEFRYSQLFTKKEEKLNSGSVVPTAVLRGFIYLRCPENSSEECKLTAIEMKSSTVIWDYLPSSRGANSSAGGADQK